MTTIPGMTCEVEVPASSATIPPPPRKEPGILTAAFGGALGTILALAVLACLLVFFDGDRLDVNGPPVAARAAPHLHLAAMHDKRLAAGAPDALRTAAAPRSLAAAVRVVRPHRVHHIAHPASRKTGLPGADLEVTNALARAELASSLP